ncbi:hypothetical protein [Bacillus sp. 7884-1]|uniref:hypothetical protein n=1 Tax=Bacillus sp. 7884-1 TaxID=2021693 RepID=UPI0015C9C6F6|nr:hypothetical protein [Bacillus sp. 7884-1]
MFALLSPSLLGTDLAALTALLLGSSKISVNTWMGISLVIWSILMTGGSVYDFKYINMI